MYKTDYPNEIHPHTKDIVAWLRQFRFSTQTLLLIWTWAYNMEYVMKYMMKYVYSFNKKRSWISNEYTGVVIAGLDDIGDGIILVHYFKDPFLPNISGWRKIGQSQNVPNMMQLLYWWHNQVEHHRLEYCISIVYFTTMLTSMLTYFYCKLALSRRYITSLMFFSNESIDEKLQLTHVLAWCRIGVRPLPTPIMTMLHNAIWCH